MSLILFTKNWQYVLLVSIYGIDSLLTIIQRLVKGENIFQAHRSHLYQYLANEVKVPHVAVSSIYAIIQLVLNIGLVFFILPYDNYLYSIFYLVLQGLFYILVKYVVLTNIEKA